MGTQEAGGSCPHKEARSLGQFPGPEVNDRGKEEQRQLGVVTVTARTELEKTFGGSKWP